MGRAVIAAGGLNLPLILLVVSVSEPAKRLIEVLSTPFGPLLCAGAYVAFVLGVSYLAYKASEEVQLANALSEHHCQALLERTGEHESAMALAEQANRRLIAAISNEYLSPSDKLYLASLASSRFHVKELHMRQEVTETLGMHATWEMTIEADSTPVTAVCSQRSCDVPVEFIGELGFRCEAMTADRELCVIPSEDTPNLRKFVTLLVPPLMPSDGPLKLITRSLWPKGAKKLAEIGKTDRWTFQLPRQILSPIPAISVEVVLPQSGHKYSVSYGGTVTYLPTAAGNCTWRSPVRNMPAGTEVLVEVTRVS